MGESVGTGRLKFGLEIATLLTAITALASVFLTYQQIQVSINATQLAAYQQMVSNAIEFDKALLARPKLRPYFKDGKPVAKNDPTYEEALLVAELQLDIIDSVVAFPLLFTNQSEKQTWGNTLQRSFRESPLMCEFLRERVEQYHQQTIEIAKKGCTPGSAQ